MQTFGEQLKEARKEWGITVEQLAVRSGVSYRTIARMEANSHDPTLSTLLKLTREFSGKQFLFEDGYYDILVQAKKRRRV
jgi:predicted transcriptional regulator